MAGFDIPGPNASNVSEVPTCKSEPHATDNGSAKAAMNGAAPEVNTTSASEPSTDEAQTKDEAPSRMDKAEQVVDRLAERIGTFTSFLGRHIVKGTSHLREATQDFWAEVQNIRRGKQE